MNIKDLMELLAEQLGHSAGELSSLIDKDGGLTAGADTTLKAAFEEKFKRVRSDGAKEGHGRGLRESLATKEKALSEKYGIEVAPLETMVDNLIVKERESIKIDPADVKKSETFTKAMHEKEALITKLKEEIDTNAKRMEFNRKEAIIKRVVPSILQKAGFSIPESELRQKKSFDILYKDLLLGDIDYKIGDNDELTPLVDGEPMQDAKYEKIGFPELVNNIATAIFDKSTGDPRRTPRSKPEGRGHTSFSFVKPSTAEEALRYMDSIKNAEERAAYVEYMAELENAGDLN